MFMSMLKALVFYPSDAVSTAHLVKEMARHRGIAYLRTTREKTPVIYSESEEFPIGGFKVLRKSDEDTALVISVGVTLHEALKAHEILKQRGIDVRVIDLYSLQPLDFSSLVENSKECGGKVITVEDHYCNALGSLLSGVSDNVTYLCVRDIPQSGKPQELRKKYGIDAAAIVKMAEQVR
jgi:transketolase